MFIESQIENKRSTLDNLQRSNPTNFYVEYLENGKDKEMDEIFTLHFLLRFASKEVTFTLHYM